MHRDRLCDCVTYGSRYSCWQARRRDHASTLIAIDLGKAPRINSVLML